VTSAVFRRDTALLAVSESDFPRTYRGLLHSGVDLHTFPAMEIAHSKYEAVVSGRRSNRVMISVLGLLYSRNVWAGSRRETQYPLLGDVRWNVKYYVVDKLLRHFSSCGITSYGSRCNGENLDCTIFVSLHDNTIL
jgi:hypothetical protein